MNLKNKAKYFALFAFLLLVTGVSVEDEQGGEK